MKKIVLAILVAALIPFVEMYAQNTMTVDSVVFRPTNPNANDPVYMHVYGWSGWGTSRFSGPTVLTSGNFHTVDICYLVGMTTMVTYIHDSVLLFTGPAGQHTVIWNIMQNNQSTDCALLLSSGQQNVNVSAVMGQEVSVMPSEPLIWFGTFNILENTIPGKLTVYAMDGSIVAEQYADHYDYISLSSYAEGLYVATLVNANGESYRLWIFKE